MHRKLREAHHTLAAKVAALCLILAGAGIAPPVARAAAPYPTPDWTCSGRDALSRFGGSVATAGDVNGDGCSDVIVGSPFYSWGSTTIGRAEVFLGSAAGMDSIPDWSRIGSSSEEWFGEAVGTAGDVNGDGYDDVLVGAPWYDGANTDEGRLSLFLGSPSGVSASPLREYTFGQHHGFLGQAVAGGGDFNGDGYDDFAAGAAWAENGNLDEGLVLVFYGRASGPDSGPSKILQIDVDDARFGASLAIAGDVNADGYDDLLAGAPNVANGGDGSGAAYVFLGGANGLASTPAWTVVCDQAAAAYGASVAGAGDTNGDGYADILVGATYYDTPHENGGKVWVYFGGPAGPSTTPAWSAVVNQARAFLGVAAAGAGDVDGDGYADIVAGGSGYDYLEEDEGTVRLYRGSPAGPSGIGFHYYGGQTDAAYGYRVATAGDVDNDGYSDFIVGSVYWSGALSFEGRAYLYNGRARTTNINIDWRMEGAAASYPTGVRPQSAAQGDFDGDGYGDVAIGDPQGNAEAGRVDVLYGDPAGLGATPDWSFAGDLSGGLLGRSVSAGDLDGDGYDELIVGAPGTGLLGAAPGSVSIFRGGPSGLAASPDRVLSGEQAASLFGNGVAWVGDANGDGCGDLVIGAPNLGPANAPTGRAYLYRGNPSTLLDPTPLVRTGAANERFGFSAAGGSDFNADGFCDWVIGSPDALDYPNVIGNIHAFFGGANPNFTPDWTERGSQDPIGFGWTVRVGEFTGNTRADIAVGAPFYSTASLTSCGRVYLYAGSANGIGSVPFWSRTGDVASAMCGYAVDTAGDVNDDGFGDLVIGEPGYSNGQAREGRVLLFHGPYVNGEDPAWGHQPNDADAYFGMMLAAAGDVNGDGFRDFLGGGRMSGAGTNPAYFLQYGGGHLSREHHARQARVSGGPLRLRGGTQDDGFRVALIGRAPIGRNRIQVEVEVKPVDEPFDGTGLLRGQILDTGAPVDGQGSRVLIDHLVDGLEAGTAVHWRARIATRSPYMPRTRWFGMAGNGPGEDDLIVTIPGSAGVEQPGAGIETEDAGLRVIGANPFRGAASLAYALPEPARVDLRVFDAAGRCVAHLAGGETVAGAHTTRWTPSGDEASSGVYYARLTVNGRDAGVTRLVRMK